MTTRYWSTGPASPRHDLLVDQFGGHHQYPRNFQLERLSGAAVDDQFGVGPLLDGQISHFGAFKDVAGIDADPTIHVRVDVVAHQPSGFDRAAIRITCWNFGARGQGDQLLAAALQKTIGGDNKDDVICALVRETRKGRIDLVARAGVKDLRLQSEGAGSFLNALQFAVPARAIGRTELNSH